METVLLYNIAGTPLASGLKPILLKMKIRVRVVTPDQYLQPIGLLAGLHGFEACADRNDRESFSEPMMVMSGFSGSRLEQLLMEMRRKKLPPIHLKAVITSQNQHWDSLTLYRELKTEHKAMHPEPES